MSFKDLYDHILMGVATTALVTVISGATSKIVPLSQEVDAIKSTPTIAAVTTHWLRAQAPQCKILTKLFEIPRCQEQAKNTERLH